jgi:flagellar protein FlaF
MAVIFVGVLISVSLAYPAVQTAYDQRTTAIDDRDQRTLEMRNTAITLTNASYDDSADELTVRVENTGSTTLSVNDTDLLVDGGIETRYNTTVEGVDRDLWQPGDVLELTQPASDGAWTDGTEPPTRVKVVTEYGVAETATDVEVV